MKKECYATFAHDLSVDQESIPIGSKTLSKIITELKKDDFKPQKYKTVKALNKYINRHINELLINLKTPINERFSI